MMIGEYTGLDNSGKPKSEYQAKLSEMSEEELYRACKQMIWLSSHAANNPRSDYHWQCDACYDECVRREDTSIYSRAYDDVFPGVR